MNSSSTTSVSPLIDSASMGILLFVNSLIGLVGIFGNVLVITAFFVSQFVRSTKYNFFLLSLAVADLLVCLVCIPMWNFVLYRESLPQPPVNMAQIEDLPATNRTAANTGGGEMSSGVDHTLNLYMAYHAYLDPLFGVASIMNLFAVSIIRCFAVHFPIHYSKVQNMYFAIGSFVLPWGIGILSLLYLRFVDNFWLYKMLVFICLVYFLPLLIIIISYSLILLGVGITRINNNAEEVSKHVVMIGIVVACFTITWAPFFSVSLVVIYCLDCPVTLLGIAVIKALQYSNSFMNVFIYAWQCKDFRNAFRKIYRAIFSMCDKKVGRSEMEPAWKDIGLSTASIAPVISMEI